MRCCKECVYAQKCKDIDKKNAELEACDDFAHISRLDAREHGYWTKSSQRFQHTKTAFNHIDIKCVGWNYKHKECKVHPRTEVKAAHPYCPFCGTVMDGEIKPK